MFFWRWDDCRCHDNMAIYKLANMFAYEFLCINI